MPFCNPKLLWKSGANYAALAIAVAGAVAPSGALAAPKIADVDKARIAMRDFATCLVKSRSSVRAKAVDTFLAMSPFSDEGKTAGVRLATPDCLSSREPFQHVAQLRFKPELLRGALFLAKFRRDFAGKPTPAFKPYDVNDSWHMVSDANFLALQSIGECAVRADPVDARSVIDGEVATAEEDKAFQAVVPALQNCMPAKGTFRFSRAVLEGLFAEALYNLSIGARTQAATPAVGTK